MPCKNSKLIGKYVGQVETAEGYRPPGSGKFYNLDGVETNLAGVTGCSRLTLEIEVVQGGLLWGNYKYTNPITGESEVDPLHGAYVGDNEWIARDADEVILLTFKGNCVEFTNIEGQSPTHTAMPGFFEMIRGSLKKC